MKRLITSDEIKTLTAAQINVDGHKFDVTIPDAEERHLRPLLGHKLYYDLLNFIQQEIPDTQDPLAALANEPKLKRCLAQWALIEAWPNIIVQITNAAVVVKTGTGQGTTVADAAQLAQVLTAHTNTAIWRGQELVRWLESNKATYPAYASNTPVATGRPPIGGINLD